MNDKHINGAVTSTATSNTPFQLARKAMAEQGGFTNQHNNTLGNSTPIDGQGINSDLNQRTTMIVNIDKQIRFDLPEGRYTATIAGLKTFQKQSAKGAQDWVRILFDVDVPGMRGYDCRAGRNFPISLKAGSDLYNFLLPVLGHEFFSSNSGKGVDMDQVLIGMQVTAKLTHFSGEGYEKPLTVVDSIQPKESN